MDRKTIERLAEIYEGIPLLGCLPGSPAERAGLRFGDIVIAVNGERTKHIDAFVAARRFRDGRMLVVVMRDGMEVTVEMEERPAFPAAVPTLRAVSAPDKLAN